MNITHVFSAISGFTSVVIVKIDADPIAKVNMISDYKVICSRV